MKILTLIAIVAFVIFGEASNGNARRTGSQSCDIATSPTPTGTATPRTPETVSRPSVLLRNSNPTLWTTCDYYFANWGSNRNPGTELRPFGLNWERIRKDFRGKLMCNINDNFGAVNGR